MANTIHQHGNGDNIAGDKVMGDKVMGDKIGTQVTGGNIGNLVHEVSGQAQVATSGLTQTSGADTADLLNLIAALRGAIAQLPAETQADLSLDLDDVEAEVQKPADQRNPLRLKKRLTALATAVTLLTGGVTAANDLADQVMELGQKLGIEMPQLPPQR